MEPVESGLKIVRPEKAGQEAIVCGFEWGADLPGDFEVTLSYRDFQSKTEQTDWQIPRLEMFCDIGGGWHAPQNTHLLFTGVRRKVDKKVETYSGHGTHVSDRYDWNYSNFNSTATSGRLRIVRRGETVYLLHSTSDSDEWLLMNKGPVSAANLKGGSFILKSEIPTSSGEVTLTEFVVKTKVPQ